MTNIDILDEIKSEDCKNDKRDKNDKKSDSEKKSKDDVDSPLYGIDTISFN
jgi:hypothetical protein